MKEYRLEELFDLQMGKTPARKNSAYWTDGTNDWISIKDLSNSGKYIEHTKEKLSDIAIEESKIKLIPENTVIMSFKLSIGKVAITQKPMFSNEAIMAFHDKKIEKISPEYLYYSFLGKNWSEGSNTAVMGVTLNKATLSKIKIKLHDFKEQQNIVNILEKCSKLIELKKQELTELDHLIKSRFVELFGDPVINDMNWTLSKLEEVCTKITDGTHDTPQRFSDGVLLITGKNIRKDRIDLTNVEYVSKEDHQVIYARCNPEYGDVLYTNIGVNYGTAVLNTFDFEFSMKNVALLKPEKHVLDGYYLWHVMNLLRDKILDQNKSGGAQTFMGLAKIKEIIIPIPDLEIQLQFTTFIKHIEELKVKVKESLMESQILFDSMMQEYFD